jgi:hypothetical protein
MIVSECSHPDAGSIEEDALRGLADRKDTEHLAIAGPQFHDGV